MCWWRDASRSACGLVMWEFQQQCQCGILLIHGPRVDPFPGGRGNVPTPQQRGSARVEKSSSLLIALDTKKSQEERGSEFGGQSVRQKKKCGHHPKSSLPECRLRKPGDVDGATVREASSTCVWALQAVGARQAEASGSLLFFMDKSDKLL